MSNHPRVQLSNTQIDASYVHDPLSLYQELCKESQHNVLLESSEIDSKENLQSLILADAALKITCTGRQVSFSAVSLNGQSVIAAVADNIDASLISLHNTTQLELNYPLPAANLDEDSRLKANSPVDALRVIIKLYGELSDLDKGVFIGGVFAYDFIASFEQLQDVADSTNICPDYQFYLAETLLLIDHQAQVSHIIGSIYDDAEQTRINQRLAHLVELCEHENHQQATPDLNNYQGKIEADISDRDFCQNVETMKDYIRQGDIFQVVPSRSFTLSCPDSLAAYRELKITNPSPYMFYLQDSEFVLFGASPESAIKYSADSRDVEIYPIAGTRRRGFNEDGSINQDLDGRLELELRLDKKETAEHIMLVDLARNDVARISEPGTRHVADLLKVDRYSHVMHLVSRVVGTLRSDLDALHAYQACMNMGTLVGAPKIRASELIRQVEQKRRGSYGGAVGYLTGNGDMDSCIVIRSAFVKDQLAHVQAGAGVVYDSLPQAEADETRSKAAAVLNAIARAHGSTLKDVSHDS
ncbi:anthranilate synthase component 1 [Agarivorans sp. MS3-6]|uniref:anthranilate synthase component 1 n=1 Tax=Agarivorans sp. TSD2052 TaxID=2937286 RepID=UPI00200F3141|nr:anthranilate synthase component 1 [Agarivorans sp. TSD2052]UPW17114.1 anthranilate synthase component 1 [Agarivorans sp. TSD2052]